MARYLRRGCRIIAALLVYLALPQVSLAQSAQFDLLLGERPIGSLDYDAGTDRLVLLITNTPLGLGLGRFEAQTLSQRMADGQAVTRYRAASTKRQISFVRAQGIVRDIVIDPATERTALSDPHAVPPDVATVTEGLAMIIAAAACPPPARIYDGRRIIEISTLSQSGDAALLTCQMDYRVTAGPGHLSPLRFRRVDMGLVYQAGALQQISLRAGLFDLRLIRR